MPEKTSQSPGGIYLPHPRYSKTDVLCRCDGHQHSWLRYLGKQCVPVGDRSNVRQWMLEGHQCPSGLRLRVRLQRGFNHEAPRFKERFGNEFRVFVLPHPLAKKS